MENPEEILHSLEEFSKLKPKDIPRELEEYLCFVAKTGDPVYQWSAIKSLFREKMINVITEFYETCPSVEIPPCPNVDIFNYDSMKNFILEKLDTFAAAPFTVQRICELLTTPRKEYNRIDKYMRALEKNVLVVSTIEPGIRRNTAENGDNIMNGLVSEHLETNSTDNVHMDINVDMDVDEAPWVSDNFIETTSTTTSSVTTTSSTATTTTTITTPNNNITPEITTQQQEETTHTNILQETIVTDSKISEAPCSSSQDSVITCTPTTAVGTADEEPQQQQQPEEPYVSIEPVPSKACIKTNENVEESNVSVTITAIPAGVQKRRSSVEPVVSSESVEISPSTTTSQSEIKSEENQAITTTTALTIPTVSTIPSEDISMSSSSEEIQADSTNLNDKDVELDPQPVVEEAQQEQPEEQQPMQEAENEVTEKIDEKIVDEQDIINNETLPPIETIKCSNIKFDDIPMDDVTIEAEITSTDTSGKEEPQSSERIIEEEEIEEPQIKTEQIQINNEAKPMIQGEEEEEEKEVVEEIIPQLNVEQEETKQPQPIIIDETKEEELTAVMADAEVVKNDEEVITAETTSDL